MHVDYWKQGWSRAAIRRGEVERFDLGGRIEIEFEIEIVFAIEFQFEIEFGIELGIEIVIGIFI